jgi:hypothetical protein
MHWLNDEEARLLATKLGTLVELGKEYLPAQFQAMGCKTCCAQKIMSREAGILLRRTDPVYGCGYGCRWVFFFHAEICAPINPWTVWEPWSSGCLLPTHCLIIQTKHDHAHTHAQATFCLSRKLLSDLTTNTKWCHQNRDSDSDSGCEWSMSMTLNSTQLGNAALLSNMIGFNLNIK